MATTCSQSIVFVSSPFLPTTKHLTSQHQNAKSCLFKKKHVVRTFNVNAAKPPAGVVTPKVEPTFNPPFLGFTKTAETWNSRACMIGLIGTFIVELIINKGILEVIGVEIGKGLDIPL